MKRQIMTLLLTASMLVSGVSYQASLAEETASPQPSATATSTLAPANTPVPSSAPGDILLADNPTKDFLTGNTYSHNPAFAGKQVIHVLDLSYHKGTIDFAKVKKAGIEHVILRVGYRGYGSSGSLSIDSKFKTYAKSALAEGIKVGAYFYSEDITTAEAAASADFVIDKLKDFDITLPVGYDFEPSTNKGRQYKAKLTKTQATDLCTTFCDRIQAAGYTPMIYASSSVFNNNLKRATLAADYKLWVARYSAGSSTNVTSKVYSNIDDPDYYMWQYSSKGKISGINAVVDCNFMYETITNKTSISKAKVSSIKKYTYTGKAKKPSPTITLNGETLKKNTDYTLSYKNNKNVGTATVTIKGTGLYKGSISKTFKIIPSKVTSLKCKAGKKQTVLTWAKNASATGYMIYRKDTEQTEKYTKIKTISNNAKCKLTVTSLKANREYFFAIRTYTKVNGKKYYGEYRYFTANSLHSSLKTKAKVLANTNFYTTTRFKEQTPTDMVIPANTVITYLGRTYLTSKKYVYHVKVTLNGKRISGYISKKASLQF